MEEKEGKTLYDTNDIAFIGTHVRCSRLKELAIFVKGKNSSLLEPEVKELIKALSKWIKNGVEAKHEHQWILTKEKKDYDSEENYKSDKECLSYRTCEGCKIHVRKWICHCGKSKWVKEK